MSLTVLPLCSLSLQREYHAFRKRLDIQLRTQTSGPIWNEHIDAAVKILQIETARSAESKAAADRDEGTMPMVDGESQSPPQFDTTGALAVLVRNATEEFGFAPCDVYDRVFNFPVVKKRHAIKLKTLKYSEPMNLSIAFFKDHSLDDALQDVVAVQPREFLPGLDRWTIDFKSPRIAREVVGLMLSIEYRHLLDTYHRLHDIGSGMAGTLFEVISHRVLCSNDAPQYIAMASTTKFLLPSLPQTCRSISPWPLTVVPIPPPLPRHHTNGSKLTLPSTSSATSAM